VGYVLHKTNLPSFTVSLQPGEKSEHVAFSWFNSDVIRGKLRCPRLNASLFESEHQDIFARVFCRQDLGLTSDPFRNFEVPSIGSLTEVGIFRAIPFPGFYPSPPLKRFSEMDTYWGHSNRRKCQRRAYFRDPTNALVISSKRQFSKMQIP
jgi:hypothetical protein